MEHLHNAAQVVGYAVFAIIVGLLAYQLIFVAGRQWLLKMKQRRLTRGVPKRRLCIRNYSQLVSAMGRGAVLEFLMPSGEVVTGLVQSYHRTDGGLHLHFGQPGRSHRIDIADHVMAALDWQALSLPDQEWVAHYRRSIKVATVYEIKEVY